MSNEQNKLEKMNRNNIFILFICALVAVLMVIIAISIMGNGNSSNDMSDDYYTVTELFSSEVSLESEENTDVSKTEESGVDLSLFESYHVKTSDMYKGDLVLVNNSHLYLFTDDSPLERVYTKKIPEYNLSTGEEKLLEKTIQNANYFIEDF